MTDTTTIAAIERRLDLRATPERVWRALTDPEELSRWFGTSASFRPEAGAAGWIGYEEEGRFHLRVEAVDAGHHLAWRWAHDADTRVDAGPSTLVEWWLEPSSDGGTTLRLRESGFLAERDVDMNTYGWFDELADLANHLASEAWQRPIRRTLELRADRDRVWRALTDPDEFRAWWGADADITPGWEGWFNFKVHGRRAVRIEAVEPPRYMAWRWCSAEKDTPLSEAREVLLTEWVLWPREDGGTNLHLLETGFMAPESRKDNDHGWDHDVLDDLRRQIDG
jgi:uncharacterized protein YndB with AHSA1/START domain